MKSRLGFFFLFLLLTLPISAVYADETLNNAATSITQSTTPSNTTTNNSTNANAAQVGSDSENLVNAYGNLFDSVGDPSQTEAANTVSSSLAPLVAGILGFFGVVIPLCVFAYTGLELACIFIKPIRPFFGADKSGGDMGGSGDKKVLLPVSEDCVAAIAGASGGGDMGGSGKRGLGDVAIDYLKLRLKTLVICLVTIGILLTPLGYNLILMIVNFIFSLITKAVGFLG